MPRSRHGMAERVQAGLLVGAVGRQHAEDDARRAEDDRQRAGHVDADAERPRGLVACACVLGRLVDARQPGARDVERGEHLVAPAPVRHVEEERSRRVGDVDCELTFEAQPHVVLRQQDVCDPLVRLRFVGAQPEQLRRGEAGQRTVAGQRDQPLEPDAFLDLGALLRGALVVPEDCRAQHPLLRVERDETVHLAREADRPVGEPLEHRLGCAPPVLGILFRPARAGASRAGSSPRLSRARHRSARSRRP